MVLCDMGITTTSLYGQALPQVVTDILSNINGGASLYCRVYTQFTPRLKRAWTFPFRSQRSPLIDKPSLTHQS